MPVRLNPKTVLCPAEAETAIKAFGLTVSQLVDQHANGDWGTFNNQDAATVIQCPVRDRAALLAMFDFGLQATDVCRISHTDIDWNTSTITITEQRQTRPPELEALLRTVRKSQSKVNTQQSGQPERSYELNVDVKSAVKEWLAESQSHSGPLFPGMEAIYLRNLMKATQSDYALANEIALLLRRGTVHSLFLFDPAPVRRNVLRRLFSQTRRREAFAVLVRTCLDSSQSEVHAPVDGPTMLGLRLKLRPTVMYGPNRKPFQCTNWAVIGDTENWTADGWH
jgi:hypothetical protein